TAARGRDPRRHRPPQSARGDPAPSPGQHPRPPGPTPTQTDPAPTHPLALGTRLDHPVAQHYRPTIQRLNHHPPDPTTRTPDRKSWADQRPTRAATSHNQDQTLNPPARGPSVESGLGVDHQPTHGLHGEQRRGQTWRRAKL